MSLALNLSALAALVPASLLAIRPGTSGGPRLWLALVVAAAGAVGWSVVRLSGHWDRSEEHTSELQSLMRSSYAVFCLKKKKMKRTTYVVYDKLTYRQHTYQ